MLPTVAANTLGNLVVLFVLPLLLFSGYHVWRHDRRLGDILGRVGLVVGDPHFLLHCLGASISVVLLLLVWPPSPDVFGREGSAQRPFVGGGLNSVTFAAALLYGVAQTGFCEEFLFRGVIAGSLAHRMSTLGANLLQASIFLLPHLAMIAIIPEAAPVMFLVFAFALFTGWVRIESGSILGPWLLHATVNVTTSLLVAIG